MTCDSDPTDVSSEPTDPAFDALLRNIAHIGPDLPPTGTLIAQKYRIESLLGCGGMGAVFAARHVVTGKLFALKWLLPGLTSDPDAVRRFTREARVGGQIEHPNVVEVYDIGCEGGTYYMLMEFVQGESLAQHLSRRQRLHVGEACSILVYVSRGLDAVHRRGVLHRDLKPHNIMLGEGIVPKVVDFGVSKILADDYGLQTVQTSRGTPIGTLQYMAPEQLRAQSLDMRVDVYALGVIAYELLSGRLPFAASNHADLICKIREERPRSLLELVPGLSWELVAVIGKAMAPDPEDRFQTVEAFGRALEPFAGGVVFSTAAPLARADTLRQVAPALASSTLTAHDVPSRQERHFLRFLAITTALAALWICYVYAARSGYAAPARDRQGMASTGDAQPALPPSAALVADPWLPQEMSERPQATPPDPSMAWMLDNVELATVDGTDRILQPAADKAVVSATTRAVSKPKKPKKLAATRAAGPQPPAAAAETPELSAPKIKKTDFR